MKNDKKQGSYIYIKKVMSKFSWTASKANQF